MRKPPSMALPQVSVAHGLTQSMSDHGQLVGLLNIVDANIGRKPNEASADAGYLSEANLEAMAARGVGADISCGRAKHPASDNSRPAGR